MKRLIRSPLFVWILILATLPLGLAVLLRIDPVQLHIEKRQREMPRKIHRAKQTKKKVDIVFFGNSLLEFAIPTTDAEISKTIARGIVRRGGEPSPVRILNLASDGRTATDLDRRSNQILGLNPRLIVIQTEMIVARRANTDQRKKGFFSKEKEQLKNWILFFKTPLMKRYVLAGTPPRRQRKLLDSLSSPAQIDIKILRTTIDAEEQETMEQKNLRRAQERWADQDISMESQRYLALRNFYQRARENGIRVLVVETPVSETAARYATDEYLRQRREVILKMLEGQDRDYLRYPRILPDKFFDDYSHTNLKGQKVFFKWLAPELAERLMEEK